MAHYKIHPIVMGTKVFDKSMMTYQYGNGQEYTIAIYCWYIEGEKERILVDTGEAHPIRTESREKAIGGRIYTFEEGLAKWNLKPEEIDVVVHTHLHNDHCENDAKCTNAKIFVHEKELERINDPHPLDYRYDDTHIWDAEDNGQFEIVTGDMEILPGIGVMHTPAHTEGGLTVLVDTAAGKAAITGFCVIKENFFPPKAVQALEMEVVPPGTHVNVYQAYDILEKIKKTADILLPLHEPEFASVDTIG
ncbi:MAG: N-acyl homoserine lactonase family protein [Proteobacteria bacterium]|nr:N-acyl homoserine lactonase family protein [Pseudomonadota bacterium]